MPPLFGLVLLLLACLALWGAGVVVLTVRTLARPPRRTYATALARGRPGDPSELGPPASHAQTSPDNPRQWLWSDWTFASRGRELPAWDIRGLDSNGPTIVLSHGWGDSRIGGLSRAAELATPASRVILWDMPGHGVATGACQLGTGEVEDLLELLGRLQGPVLLYGWSLGAGVSIAAAAGAPPRIREQIVGVIAEAPYRHANTPARNVLSLARLPHRFTLRAALLAIEHILGATGLNAPAFDRAALASRLDAPLLVVHGERDDVCPIADGQAIAAAARNGHILILPGGGHHGLWTQDATAPLLAARCTQFVRGLRVREG